MRRTYYWSPAPQQVSRSSNFGESAFSLGRSVHLESRFLMVVERLKVDAELFFFLFFFFIFLPVLPCHLPIAWDPIEACKRFDPQRKRYLCVNLMTSIRIGFRCLLTDFEHLTCSLHKSNKQANNACLPSLVLICNQIDWVYVDLLWGFQWKPSILVSPTSKSAASLSKTRS